MAKNKTVYLAEFDAKGEAYARKLNEAERKTIDSTNKMSGAWKSYGASIMSVVSVAAVSSFLKNSVEKFIEQEKAVKKLDAALGRHSQTLLKQAAALQKVSVYGDEEIIKQQAFLAALKFSEAQIKRIIPVALDLATATGQTLEFAVRNTAKTFSGLSGELGELVPQLRVLTKEQMMAGDAVEVMAGLFGGMAKAEAETLGGEIQILNNRFGDFQERLGEGLVPVLKEVMNYLEGTLGLLERFADSQAWNIIKQIRPGVGSKITPYSSNLLFDPGFGGQQGGSRDPRFSSDPTNPMFWIPPASSGGSIGGGKTGGKKGKKPIPMIGTRKMDRPLSYLDAVVGNMGNRGGDSSGYNPLSGFSAQMTETVIPEFEMKFEEVGDSFVNKFGHITDIGNQLGNILNISADSFVGKLIDGVNTMSQVLSLITSIVSLASGGGVTSLFGLAKGGVVVNRGGQMSLGNLPKFATGGSYMVPSGYMNDSGLIRVQSGERVDVTPNTRVPLVESMLKQTKSAIMAMNRNMVAGAGGGGGGQAPLVLNHTLEDSVMRYKLIENRQIRNGVKYKGGR